MNDNWFILTVTFACLNAVAILTIIGIFIVYKKQRIEYVQFRKQKEKWLKYDNTYKHGDAVDT